MPQRRLPIGLVVLVAALAAGPSRAEWRVRELQETSGSGPSIEMSYRSSGERLTLLCSAGAAFVSFSPGYRLPEVPDGQFEGSYSVDNGPPKPIRWRVTRNSAFVTARFATLFLADIAGAAQVFIKFPAVEQTYDVTPISRHARRLKSICLLDE
ncbi:MAG: hypothetical protein ACT6XY_05665 [Phreatobacter sp.]|jgi:hypothetical protein|uniref:hypothetical protein n=1 Tax=Phreatobacter sp. TaxID=1966341 RepID=UPI00403549A0